MMNDQVLITLTQGFSIYIISNETKQILYHLLSSRPYALTVAEDTKIFQVQHHFPISLEQSPLLFCSGPDHPQPAYDNDDGPRYWASYKHLIKEEPIKPAFRADQEPQSYSISTLCNFCKTKLFQNLLIIL